MSDIDYFKGSHNPLNFIKSLFFDRQFYHLNPSYMDPCGIWVFCGAQGSGKTLSAVKCLKALVKEYPGAVVCSNLNIYGLDCDIVNFSEYELLGSLDNGYDGVIFLIDEIHVLWNSLESRNIPISEIGIFSQNRKSRRIILGTSQVYSRIAKPIREQLRYCILCNSLAKYIQINTIVDPNSDGQSGEHDGELEGEVIGREWFIHSPDDYMSYSTLDKIERIERKKAK